MSDVGSCNSMFSIPMTKSPFSLKGIGEQSCESDSTMEVAETVIGAGDDPAEEQPAAPPTDKTCAASRMVEGGTGTCIVAVGSADYYTSSSNGKTIPSLSAKGTPQQLAALY
jgi:hypothetical protein